MYVLRTASLGLAIFVDAGRSGVGWCHAEAVLYAIFSMSSSGVLSLLVHSFNLLFV